MAIVAVPPLLADRISAVALVRLLWYIAPLSYGAAAVFVMPVFAVWSASRVPSPGIGAVWGAAASCIAFVLLGVAGAGSPRHDLHFLMLAGAPGAASGLLYVWLVRRPAER